jgi:hypothetical protein
VFLMSFRRPTTGDERRRVLELWKDEKQEQVGTRELSPDEKCLAVIGPWCTL